MPISKNPLVSVLMAYYDNPKYIEQAIVSVMNQTYRTFELVVVDDCSPSAEGKRVIGDLADKYGFKLIRHTKNMGAAKAFRTAFENSSGELISIISHDDLYTEDKLEYMMSVLSDKGLDVLYCNGSSFKDDDLRSAVPFDDTEVMAAQSIGQSSVADLISSKDTVGCLLTQGALYRRSVWKEQENYRERFLLDDWPFTIIAWKNYATMYDPHNVYYYRLHEDNIHKNYLKWLPARIQTVCELVDKDRKNDVIGRILIDVGSAALNQGESKMAFSFVSAGMMMVESENDVRHADNLLLRLSQSYKDPMMKRKIEALRSGNRRFSGVSYFLRRVKNKLVRVIFRRAY